MSDFGVMVDEGYGGRGKLEGAHLGLWLKLNALGRRIMALQAKARADKVRRGCGCAGMSVKSHAKGDLQ